MCVFFFNIPKVVGWRSFGGSDPSCCFFLDGRVLKIFCKGRVCFLGDVCYLWPYYSVFFLGGMLGFWKISSC